MAWDDYLWLQKNDKRALKRVNLLIKDVSREAYVGLGEPEALHGDLSGYWSRRLNKQDRLVYNMVADTLNIIGCRTHYGDK